MWAVVAFGAMFRKQLNRPPLEFHIRLRMQRACELPNDDHTAAEIADWLGYGDPLYLPALPAKGR